MINIKTISTFIILNTICLHSFSNSLTIKLNDYEKKVTSHIQKLDESINQLNIIQCKDKQQLIQTWSNAYIEYLAISYMDLEVISQNNLTYSFAFWPDKKNLIAKKMNELIAVSPITATTIDQASAPVKGFQALEFLLFDDSQTTLNCEAFKAISATLKINSIILINHIEQSPIIKLEFLENSRQLEGASIAFNQISNHLTAIIKKSETVINDKKNEKLFFSDAWRSKQDLFFHKQNLNNSIQFSEIFLSELSQKNQIAITEKIKLLQSQISQLSNSYAEIYATQKQDLLFMHITTIKQFNQLLGQAILDDLNIKLGFNNSDGD